MKSSERSLRFLIEKWLTRIAAAPIRLSRFTRTGFPKWRYVRVEIDRPEGPVSLFFFRHDDGT